MPSRSGSDDRTQPIGIRRPVEMPVTDVEAADIAPASGSVVADETAPVAGAASEGEGEQPAPAGGETTDAGPAGSAPAEEGLGDAAEPAASPDEGAEPAAGGKAGAKGDRAGGDKGEKAGGEEGEKAGKKEKRGAWLRNAAVASASAGATATAGDEMPPDRPRKPVLAAVAIGGVVLLAIPILLVGKGSHEGKKQRTTVAANRVMSGDGQAAPGAYVSTSPTPTASASASVSPSRSASSSPASAKSVMPDSAKTSTGAEHGVTAQSRGGFRGVANVLLKNVVGGSCADVPGYDREWAGLNLQTGHCTPGDTDNQVWSLRVVDGPKGPGGKALYTIRNTKSEACMDLHGTGAGKSGAAVDQDYCKPTRGDNQLWYLTHVRGSLYQIHNAASHGLCLGVGGRSGAVEKPLVIHGCGASDGWSWSSGG